MPARWSLPLAADGSLDHEKLCSHLRWPGGQPSTCPRCGAPDPASSANRRWRCSACGRYFTVTTGTPLQGSRISVQGWAEAARQWWTTGEIKRRLCVSYPTARRVARLLEATGSPPGNDRLAAILRSGAPEEEASGESHAAETGGQASISGLDRLPLRQRQAVRALAALHQGATAGRIAEYAGMTPGHARRCMKVLAERGLVRSEVQSVPCGYKMADCNVWDFATEELRMEAMRLPFLAPRPQPPPASVPVEFWWALWSEPTADRIDLTDEDDCLAAAARLVACPHPAPKNWALMALPLTVLRKLRAVRGYDRGEIAQAIDGAIAARANADDDH